MNKVTITEALAEVKLIEKKIDRKIEYVRGNLVRPSHVADPFEKEGGGREVVRKEIQAIEDLFIQLVRIRAAISFSNNKETAVVMGQEKTITEWLAWKKEVANKRSNFYAEMHKTLKGQLDSLLRQPQVWKDEKGENHMVNLVSNADYSDFVKKHSDNQEVLDKLDGVLSLKNATTLVEI